MRRPVITLFGFAILWLIVGSFLGLASAWKLVQPGILDSFPWLAFGRLRPAHVSAVAYGWALPAGLGVALWIMARLCRTALPSTRWLTNAAIFWNLGVLIGVVGILAGHGTSIEWLDFPGYAAPILFVSFVSAGLWVAVLFQYRKPDPVFISEWYLLAAILSFPWLYAAANILLVWSPVPGSAHGPINWWYGSNLFGLWFTPIGLGAAYYLIPKIVARPVFSASLAQFGFWALIVFYVWTGMNHLIGGPVPVWMISVSVVASVLLLVAILAVAVTLHGTMRGDFHALKSSPTLRFTVFGAMTYTVVALQGCLMAIPSLNTFTHFTDFTIGHAHLGLYGFFSMILFGAIYFIMPRLTGGEWPSAKLIHWHFWLAAIGLLLMVAALTIGGLLQGLAQYDPSVSFRTSLEFATPFRIVRGLSGILLLAGHLLFGLHFFWMLWKPRMTAAGPTLFDLQPTPEDAPERNAFCHSSLGSGSLLVRRGPGLLSIPCSCWVTSNP